MRNLLFLFLGLSLFACKSELQKNKAAIETLATDWQAATNSVTEINEVLTGDLTEFSAAGKDYILSDEAIAGLKGDGADEYNAVLSNYKVATNERYGTMIGELNNFVSDWVAKTAQLTALTEGLKSGKFDGNITESIASLTTDLANANNLVSAFTEKREALKTDANSATEKLKRAYEMVMPKK